MKTLADSGGTAFFVSYLEQVATSSEAKWSSGENVRMALRAVLQYQKQLSVQMAALKAKVAEGGEEKGDGTLAELARKEASVPELYRSIELLLALATKGNENAVTLLSLFVRLDEKVSPATLVVGASLVEHVLTRLSGDAAAADAGAAAPLDEAVGAWAGQVLGLASTALTLAATQLKPAYKQLGGNNIQLVSAALEASLTPRETWEELVERLIAMVGRACTDSSAALSGLLKAWSEAASPELLASSGGGHMLKQLSSSSATYAPTSATAEAKTPHNTSMVSVSAAGWQMWDAEQLENMISGFAKLALCVRKETGALDAFGKLVPLFPTTYMRLGSKLREQVCALMLEPGPNFTIDAAWGTFLRDKLIDHPLFWSKHVPALFDSALALSSPDVLVDAIMKTLADSGGTAFFVSYLEQVATSSEAKWSSGENVRMALRAVLQYQKQLSVQMAALKAKVAEGGEEKGDGTLAELARKEASVPELYRSIELLLALATKGNENAVTLLSLFVRLDEKVSPATLVVGASLVEHVLTRLSGDAAAADAGAAAPLDEAVGAWAGQVLGLASTAFKLPPPLQSSVVETLGGASVQLVSAAVAADQVSQAEWEELVERLIAMVGRAARSPTSPLMAGLLTAWLETASPSLLKAAAATYLQVVLKESASAPSQTAADKVTEPVLTASSLAVSMSPESSSLRDAARLEALVLGMGKLAWTLPSSADALEAFGTLALLTKPFLMPGSAVRERLCTMLLEPGPNFTIDAAWGTFLRDKLIDHPRFWSKDALALFVSDSSSDVVGRAVKTLLAEDGGATFVHQYIEQVCDASCGARWGAQESILDHLKTVLRAFLQHEKVVMTCTKTLESEIEKAKDLKEALANKKKGDAAPREEDEVDAPEDPARTEARCAEEMAKLKGGLAPLHKAVRLLISLSIRDPRHFDALLPLWVKPAADSSPGSALAGAAKALKREIASNEAAYLDRREKGALDELDLAHERAILAMVRLFVENSESLTGFQECVPRVFDGYLALGTTLRASLCEMLLMAGQEAYVVEKIRADDALARQPFFWSAPGMKLFGGHPDLKVPEKLRQIVNEAIDQQPHILVAFLQQACDKVFAELESQGSSDGTELGVLIKVSLGALLAYVGRQSDLGGPDIDGKRKGVLDAVELVMVASTRLFDHVYPKALEAWAESDSSTKTLNLFVKRFRRQIGATTDPTITTQSAGSDEHVLSFNALKFYVTLSRRRARASEHRKSSVGEEDEEGEEEAAAAEDDMAIDGKKAESIILTLANLFVALPAKLNAFSQLVPEVFQTHLKLGTPLRDRLNGLLFQASFEARLKDLVANTDDLVGSAFFWNDQVIPLTLTLTLTLD